MAQRQSTHWCFTLCNPTNDETVLDLENLFWTHPGVKYAVFQLEEGSESEPGMGGIIHYQGYLELTRSQRRSYVSKILPRAYITFRKGTQKQARDYCMKEDTRWEGPWECGTFTPCRVGQRTDLASIKKTVLNPDTTMLDVLPMCQNFQQLRFAEALMKYKPQSHRWEPKEVHWYWGPTGSGKTRAAQEACKDVETWTTTDPLKWFDGYMGQTHVIIDEFRAGNCAYNILLGLLDGYERRVQIKCSHTIWKPKVIYITAPLPPNQVYAGQLEYHGSVDQLLRRITEIKEFKKDDEPRREPNRSNRVTELIGEYNALPGQNIDPNRDNLAKSTESTQSTLELSIDSPPMYVQGRNRYEF